jgi:hypothetical protein
MGINTRHVRDRIIIPALDHIGLNSPAAVNLELATAATESRMGASLIQVGGPALGLFQMEPATHADVWANFLRYQGALRLRVLELVGDADLDAAGQPKPEAMVHNFAYAAAMARVHYRRFPEPLPRANDRAGLWTYYKTRWNTTAGKATRSKFEQDWAALVEGFQLNAA